MKKYIFGVLLLGVLLVTPVFADTTADQIANLQAQIAVLTAQLNQLLAQQNQNGFCFSFTRDLQLEDRGVGNGSDVFILNQILIEKEKLSTNLPAGSFEDSISYQIFYPETEMMVKQFQSKYGILSTGYVGPLTRAKLNSLYGCKKPPVNNQAPIISGISGPTSLKVGEMGTWTIGAYDSNAGVLSYQVLWGDESAVSQGVMTLPASPRADRQSATFTHTYGSAGNYRPTFIVTNSANKSANTSITVTVGQTTQPQITVTAPNGGENWLAGSTQAIKWNAIEIMSQGGVSPVAKYDLYLDHYYPPCTGQVCPMYMPYLIPITLDKNISGNVYNWIVATEINSNAVTIPAGQYRIRVCQAGGQAVCDSSDQPFTIFSQAVPVLQ